MIYILFNPGTFGSTVEYVIRNFTKEFEQYKLNENGLQTNGSMHGFKKLNHIYDKDSILNFCSNKNNLDIVSLTYTHNNLTFENIVNLISKHSNTADDKLILLYVNTIRSAELNLLFGYYKIPCYLENTFSKLTGYNDISLWNNNYSSWKDMELWEFREWFSMFYPSWIQSWIDIQHHVDQRYYSLTNIDFLENTEFTFNSIINYLGLTITDGLFDFLNTWRNSQQYIIEEYNLIESIVDSILKEHDLFWDKLSIVSESMVQKKLKDYGYEIKCYGLDEFPTSSQQLKKLVEKMDN